MTLKLTKLAAAFAGASMLTLAGCGGGDGSTASTADMGGNITPTPQSLALNGTVATGLALAGGTVNVMCANNTSAPTTATTVVNAVGQYSISIPNAALPCILQAVGKDSGGNPITLYSFTSSSNTANITPLTDAVVTQALSTVSTTPAATYTNTAFTQTAATSLTNNLSVATNTVVANAQALVGSAATLPSTPAAIFNTTFTPATTAGGTNSDPVDSAIDTLVKIAITAAGRNTTFTPTVQIAIASLESAIAASGSTTPTATTVSAAIATAAPITAATIASAASLSYASKLSPDQAAFESLGLNAPGGSFRYRYFVRFLGGLVDPNYLYSQNEQLAVSPFTSGPQTVTYLPAVNMLKTLPVPAGGGVETGFVVNGSILVAAFPPRIIVSYPLGSTGVQIDGLAADGKSVLASTLRSNYQASSLTGTVISTPATSPFYIDFSPFFTNTSLLSNTATWQSQSTAVSFTNTNINDSYQVFDANCVPSTPLAGPFASGISTGGACYINKTIPTPVGVNTTIAALMANGLSIKITSTSSSGASGTITLYSANNGTTKFINGVNTYVATSQIESGTGVYRSFYELNGNVYVGTYVPAGLVRNQNLRTNNAARDSFSSAQNY